jgi:quercetin dioxygenase-like cupin family protein
MVESDRQAVVRPGFVIRRIEQGLEFGPEILDRIPSAVPEQEPGKEILREFLANNSGRSKNVISMFETGLSASLEYVKLNKGIDFPKHYHKFRDAMIYIISGAGVITLGTESFPVEKGACVFIERGVVHEIHTDTGMEYIAVIRVDKKDKELAFSFDFSFDAPE